MGAALIDLRGITKSYSGGVKVLEEVSLSVRKGEFLYVVGGIGTGKTTLLRILATEEPVDTGEIQLFGYSLNRVNPNTLSAIRRSIGYIPQGIRLIPDLTVEENVRMALTVSSRAFLSREAKKSVQDALERLGVGALRSRVAKTLSGGGSQRVAIARALARKPEFLIADEPTGAQDRASAWALMDTLMKCQLDGTTVVVATHDAKVVRRVRKRSVTLNGGRIFTEDRLCTY